LADIWQQGLTALQLPSTRMLFSQQARLLLLSPSPYPRAAPGELVALVQVATQRWLPMVESRRDLIANALGKVLGCPVCVALIAAGGEL
jgi:DNA polymerase-3 subunit gamma/tau